MAGEKKTGNSDLVSVGEANLCSKLPRQNQSPNKERAPTDLNSNSNIKDESGRETVAEYGVNHPPTVYDYFYPGFNGAFTQLDDSNYFNGGGSYTGPQSDNNPFLYYLPGYNPYATGTFMGVDGQQQYLSSSGYIQHPTSYSSELMPCYSWDSTYAGDVTNRSTSKSGNTKPGLNSKIMGNPNGFNVKRNNTSAGVPRWSSKSQESTLSNNISKSTLQQSFKSSDKLGSGFPSAGFLKDSHPNGKFVSLSNQNCGLFPHNGPSSYRPHGKIWNGNGRFKSRDRSDKTGEFESSTALTRGPRAQNRNNPRELHKEDNHLEHAVQGSQYNLEDFQTNYTCAKFFVIKSYSEDDVHKCIKYDVWSSTPYGNKKLDAAFNDAEANASGCSAKCPVFLFFSINGSGQFVGLAEMIGKVDFNKSMDFWQLDKWTGFFPVKWHIIKDVPNTQLQHIILENNDYRSVTYSRDTQEIGLNHGLEMLKIFKTYKEKTSLLDDFNFYEDREKSLKARKNGTSASKPQKETHETVHTNKHVTSGEGLAVDGLVVGKASSEPFSSLVNLTKGLSISSLNNRQVVYVSNKEKV